MAIVRCEEDRQNPPRKFITGLVGVEGHRPPAAGSLSASAAQAADAQHAPGPRNTTRISDISQGDHGRRGFFGLTTRRGQGCKHGLRSGQTDAYIKGETAPALCGGRAYGSGGGTARPREPEQVYWRGPSVASRSADKRLQMLYWGTIERERRFRAFGGEASCYWCGVGTNCAAAAGPGADAHRRRPARGVNAHYQVLFDRRRLLSDVRDAREAREQVRGPAKAGETQRG